MTSQTASTSTRARTPRPSANRQIKQERKQLRVLKRCRGVMETYMFIHQDEVADIKSRQELIDLLVREAGEGLKCRHQIEVIFDEMLADGTVVRHDDSHQLASMARQRVQKALTPPPRPAKVQDEQTISRGDMTYKQWNIALMSQPAT
jgi:hypothetical protein